MALLHQVPPQVVVLREQVERVEDVSDESLVSVLPIGAADRYVRLAEPRLVFADVQSLNLNRDRPLDAVLGFPQILDEETLNGRSGNGGVGCLDEQPAAKTYRQCDVNQLTVVGDRDRNRLAEGPRT